MNHTGTGSSGLDAFEPGELSNLRNALSALQTGSPELSAKLAKLSVVVAMGNYQIDAQALIGSIIRDASAHAA